MTTVYLDNNATTRTDPRVVAAMLPCFTDMFGNPSSPHAFGQGVAEAVRGARRRVRALLGARHDQEILFVSGGTEADNTALLSAVATAPEGRREIITSAVEHPAILATLAHLERSCGVRVHLIGVDGRGRLDLDAFYAALGPRTALVSVMWANNETGTLFPVADLARAAHAAGALFHTDAVQAAGRIPVDLSTTEIDFLSLSGHKLHGPKGIGVLFVRKGIPFRPLILGGHQERGRRAGTENVAAIVGLGVAAEIAVMGMAGEGASIASKRDRLERALTALVPGCQVNGDTAARLPNTLNLAFDCVDGEALQSHLGRAGIAVSTGAACASGSSEPSHVLKAMALPVWALMGAIRLSLSRETTDAEIDRVIALLPPIVARLREMSPLWNDRRRLYPTVRTA